MNRLKKTIAIFCAELSRADLSIYTVCVMAQRDLDANNFASAVARLRVDADKLRSHDTPLNDLLLLADSADSEDRRELKIDALLDAYLDNVPQDYSDPVWSDDASNTWRMHVGWQVQKLWTTFDHEQRRALASAAQDMADKKR